MNEVSKVEQRILDQIERNTPMVDIKIDLKEFLNHAHILSDEELTHKFAYEDITEQDCLLMQVPNINESGYYAGVVALKSYIDKFHSDLQVAIIDPVIDYFYLNPPDKQGEFFNLFNTYSQQGNWELLYNHKETHDIIEGFVFNYIEKTNPAFFGFSIIDGNIDASLAIANKIKEKYPHIKILFGGNGIQLLDFGALPASYNSKEYDFVDIFVVGDGEVTFVELLKSDFTEDSLKQIKGIVWRNKQGRLVHNIQRENIDMETLPFPDYSSLEENYYYHSTYQYQVPLVLSRGCPYRCTFCTVPEFIPQFRYRTIESVLDEIEYWINKGKLHFFCHDSIINGNPKWFKNFCEKVIERGWPDIGFTFGGNMRLGKPMRDLDTMRLYRKAGLTKMITGFESASEPVLKHMKKYTNMEGVREIFENVRIINQENADPYYVPMQFAMQLIIGYLNETQEDFQRTVDFVKEYHDCMSEILTCSAFLLHTTLKESWAREGEYLLFYNAVNFVTNYNTPEERLEWLDISKKLFEDIGINHSVYNRGLYIDLKENYDNGEEYNIKNKKVDVPGLTVNLI